MIWLTLCPKSRHGRHTNTHTRTHIARAHTHQTILYLLYSMFSFVFLIVVVLMNLLNGLAVHDTNVIRWERRVSKWNKWSDRCDKSLTSLPFQEIVEDRPTTKPTNEHEASYGSKQGFGSSLILTGSGPLKKSRIRIQPLRTNRIQIHDFFKTGSESRKKRIRTHLS